MHVFLRIEEGLYHANPVHKKSCHLQHVYRDSCFISYKCFSLGGVRPVHHKSTCLTQLTSGTYVAQMWSRNRLLFVGNATLVFHRVGISKQGKSDLYNTFTVIVTCSLVVL